MEIEKSHDEVLEVAAKLFKSAHKNSFAGTVCLYRIRKEKMWEGKYSSFSEYLERECGLSDSQASRLLRAYEHFVIDNHFAPAQIETVSAEKLYLAASLKMTPEQQLASAHTLTRRELREELATGGGEECPCETFIKICARCGKKTD